MKWGGFDLFDNYFRDKTLFAAYTPYYVYTLCQGCRKAEGAVYEDFAAAELAPQGIGHGEVYDKVSHGWNINYEKAI